MPGRPSSRVRQPLIVGAVVVLAVAVIGAAAAMTRDDTPSGSSGPPGAHRSSRSTPPTSSAGPAYRAFEANSWWNSPVPASAPHNPDSARLLAYLRTAPDNAGGCLHLAGAERSPWGQPVYWARPGDPTYDVSGVPGGGPPELRDLRIPKDARAADNTDGSMSIFDLRAGYVTLLTDASYDAQRDQWSASGATVTYLDSNGLDVRTGKSDNPGNTGTHRGNNGADSVVRWDEVQAGAIDHVLKVSSGPEMSDRSVFPMTASDGDLSANEPGVPPQGLRLRIKPSIPLDQLGLDPEALVIARALQTYGMYLGDSGGATALKLEDTVSEGRGQFWDVTTTELCRLPFSPAYWDVLPDGYDPSGTN